MLLYLDLWLEYLGLEHLRVRHLRVKHLRLLHLRLSLGSWVAFLRKVLLLLAEWLEAYIACELLGVLDGCSCLCLDLHVLLDEVLAANFHE